MPYKFNPVTGKLDYYEAGSGSTNLATVLANGNTSGANDINFDTTQGLYFNNSSRLREGTIDALLGGSKGIAQICAVGYELKWEAGRLYVMDGNGIYIRHSLYNFTLTPSVNDDLSLGYLTGSRWSLDDGTTYVCSDPTIGAAVWAIQQIDYLDFNTSAGHTVAEGEMAWNNTDGTVDLGMQGGLKNKIGHQLFVKARNNSGSAITKGSVVKVVGVAGGFIGINLAQGDSDANSATAFGIVAEDIADTSNGFVCINGIIHGLNTNSFTEGDVLYLSPSVAGTFTNVKPVAPQHAVVVGYVAKKSATDGHILLHVQNGLELDELHNVSINSGTLANNNALIYESATQLWKNIPIPNPEGWSVIVKSANQDVTGATLQDDTELQFSVVAGGTYMIELNLATTGDSSVNDYRFGFTVSSGTINGSGNAFHRNGSNAATQTVLSASTASTNAIPIGQNGGTIPSGSGIIVATANFGFYATANAIFKMQFALVSNSGTARTCKGSILKYKRLD